MFNDFDNIPVRSYESGCESLNTTMFYRNEPKFLDSQVLENSVYPDQTPRGAVWSGSTLFAIPSASFGPITLQ